MQARADATIVTLRWTLADGEATGAEVRYKTSDQSWHDAAAEAALAPGGPLSVQVPELGVYDMRVEVYNRIGRAVSEPVTVTAAADTSAPTNLRLNDRLGGGDSETWDTRHEQLRVSWDDPADAASAHYVVRWAAAGQALGTDRQIVVTDKVDTSPHAHSEHLEYLAEIGGLDGEVPYLVSVTAHGPDGELGTTWRAFPTVSLHDWALRELSVYESSHPWVLEIFDNTMLRVIESPGGDAANYIARQVKRDGVVNLFYREGGFIGLNPDGDMIPTRTLLHEIGHAINRDYLATSNPLAVVAGWLYFHERIEGLHDYDCEVKRGLRRGNRGARQRRPPPRSMSGLTDWPDPEWLEAAESVVEGRVPQWF